MKIAKYFLQGSSLRLFLCAIALGCSFPLMAQDDNTADETATAVKQPTRRRAVADKYPMMTLKGKVVDQTSKKPLAGVQMRTLGNHNYAAMTKADGTFSIKVPTFTTSLYVYSAGYMAQQVAVVSNDPNQAISIQMMPDNYRKMYDDGTSYTAQKTYERTGSNNNITIESDIENNLGADVRAIAHSAAPGAGMSMFLRGINSLNANAQPLIVIDGVEQDMQRNRLSLHDGQFNDILANISPDDIASVQVLKNGTALYGARGGNGVILINTKRGHSMATRIDANISGGFTLVPQLPTMMNATQYRNYASEMLGTVQENIDRTTPIEFRFLNDDPKGYYYNMYHNNTDWTDYVYRTAYTQNYSVNVQGGDDIGMYNLSVGYVDGQSTTA